MNEQYPSHSLLGLNPPAQWIILRLYSHADDDFLDFADDPDSTKNSHAARPWSIVVVDDDDEVHHAIDLALGGANVLGHPLRVTHCKSTAAARSNLIGAGEPVDLVLLDVVMETADAGLNLLKELRALPATRDLPVLLHTGQPGQAPEAAVRSRYDISGYLTKSQVTRSTLIAALEAALSGKSMT